jgi:hypothetical protein
LKNPERSAATSRNVVIATANVPRPARERSVEVPRDAVGTLADSKRGRGHREDHRAGAGQRKDPYGERELILDVREAK